jgi:hypothetical protein
MSLKARRRRIAVWTFVVVFILLFLLLQIPAISHPNPLLDNLILGLCFPVIFLRRIEPLSSISSPAASIWIVATVSAFCWALISLGFTFILHRHSRNKPEDP